VDNFKLIIKVILIGLVGLILSGCMSIPVKSAVNYLQNNPIKFSMNVYTSGGKEVVANVQGTLKF
jgi:starvation-inducible outer membrane lipoprotein